MKKISNLIIILLFIALFSFLIYLIYQNLSGIYIFSQVYKYYVIFFFMFLCLCFIYKIKNEIVKFRVILVIISTIISLYAVEIFIVCYGVLDVNKRQYRQAKKLGIKYDIRTKHELIKDLRMSGKTVYPVFLPKYFLSENSDIIPLSGISRMTTDIGNETGKHILYKTDRFGFNNDDSCYNKELEIVLIGDSFTHGFCVPQDKNIAGWLRQNGINTASFGMGGNGPLMELGTLIEYGLYFKPKKVVWLFCPNDIGDIRKELKNNILVRYMNNGFTQGLINRQKEIDKIVSGFLDKKFKSYEADEKEKDIKTLTYMTRLYHIRKCINLAEYRHVEINNDIIKPIIKAKNLVNSWGGKFYFIYLPFYAQCIEDDKFEIETHDTILKMVSYSGINVIKVLDSFKKHPDNLSLFSLRMKNHYSAKGYKLIAEIIENELFSTHK